MDLIVSTPEINLQKHARASQSIQHIIKRRYEKSAANGNLVDCLAIVRIVIGLLVIELLGFYPIDPYLSLLLYICFVSPLLSINFSLGFSISLHGIRVK